MDNTPNRRADDKRAAGQLQWGESGSAVVGAAQPSAALYGAIMNLPANVPESCKSHELMMAYKIGHRDARHCAADLVVASEAVAGSAAAQEGPTLPKVESREFHELAMDYRGASFSGAHKAYQALVAHVEQLVAAAGSASPAAADERSDEAFKAAVDAEYPIPDNPHASVIQRATDSRAAMWRGIIAARRILAQGGNTSGSGSAAAGLTDEMQRLRKVSADAILALNDAKFPATARHLGESINAVEREVLAHAGAPAEGIAQQLERIAASWDGHLTETKDGEEFDIGTDLRREFATIVLAHAGGGAQPVATVEAGKFANRLQWISDEVMGATPVGSKLYLAAPSSDDVRNAGYEGVIDAGDYDIETGMMRITVKLLGDGLPIELRTIGSAVELSAAAQSESDAGQDSEAGDA